MLLEHWSSACFTRSKAVLHSVSPWERTSPERTGQGQRAQLVNGATYDDIVLKNQDRNAMIPSSSSIPPYLLSPNLVPRGVYGSSGRNIISGPATNRTDLSLMKDMVIREQLRLQLRASFSTPSIR